MAIQYNGKTYEPEEVLKLPEKVQKIIMKRLSAQDGHPSFNNEELLHQMECEGGIYIDEKHLQDKDIDNVPVTELHSIKNPKAMKMYEALIASGTPHIVAMERIQDLFDIEKEDDSDRDYCKLKEVLESRGDYPMGLKQKILSHAVTRGVSIDKAINEVTVNANKYLTRKG